MIAIALSAALGLASPVASSGELQGVDYFKEAQAIWRTFVPPSGQAETEQGELLRAVEKLRDEAMRNGNGNWDAGFEILLAYLEQHLADPQVYDGATLARTQSILVRLKDYENPLLDDAPFDELADRAVDYYRHYGSRPHARNPALHR
jgi:hypothetical protein